MYSCHHPVWLACKKACTLNSWLLLHLHQATVKNLFIDTIPAFRHLAALKQRELENARVTAEEMEKQMGPLRCCVLMSIVLLLHLTCYLFGCKYQCIALAEMSTTEDTSVFDFAGCSPGCAFRLCVMHLCFCCRQSVNEYQKTKDTKYASAETSAREWAEVTAKANMHKGKWSEYWEEAKAAGDLGNEKVCPVFSEC